MAIENLQKELGAPYRLQVYGGRQKETPSLKGVVRRGPDHKKISNLAKKDVSASRKPLKKLSQREKLWSNDTKTDPLFDSSISNNSLFREETRRKLKRKLRSETSKVQNFSTNRGILRDKERELSMLKGRTDMGTRASGTLTAVGRSTKESTHYLDYSPKENGHDLPLTRSLTRSPHQQVRAKSSRFEQVVQSTEKTNILEVYCAGREKASQVLVKGVMPACKATGRVGAMASPLLHEEMNGEKSYPVDRRNMKKSVKERGGTSQHISRPNVIFSTKARTRSSKKGNDTRMTKAPRMKSPRRCGSGGSDKVRQEAKNEAEAFEFYRGGTHDLSSKTGRTLAPRNARKENLSNNCLSVHPFGKKRDDAAKIPFSPGWSPKNQSKSVLSPKQNSRRARKRSLSCDRSDISSHKKEWRDPDPTKAKSKLFAQVPVPDWNFFSPDGSLPCLGCHWDSLEDEVDLSIDPSYCEEPTCCACYFLPDPAMEDRSRNHLHPTDVVEWEMANWRDGENMRSTHHADIVQSDQIEEGCCAKAEGQMCQRDIDPIEKSNTLFNEQVGLQNWSRTEQDDLSIRLQLSASPSTRESSNACEEKFCLLFDAMDPSRKGFIREKDIREAVERWKIHMDMNKVSKFIALVSPEQRILGKGEWISYMHATTISTHSQQLNFDFREISQSTEASVSASASNDVCPDSASPSSPSPTTILSCTTPHASPISLGSDVGKDTADFRGDFDRTLIERARDDRIADAISSMTSTFAQFKESLVPLLEETTRSMRELHILKEPKDGKSPSTSDNSSKADATELVQRLEKEGEMLLESLDDGRSTVDRQSTSMEPGDNVQSDLLSGEESSASAGSVTAESSVGAPSAYQSHMLALPGGNQSQNVLDVYKVDESRHVESSSSPAQIAKRRSALKRDCSVSPLALDSQVLDEPGRHMPRKAPRNLSLTKESIHRIHAHRERFTRYRKRCEADLEDTALAQWQIVEILADDIMEDILEDMHKELETIISDVAESIFQAL